MEVGNHWREWELTDLIGAGSYGKVFKIRRTGINNFVEESALKVIRIPLDPSDYHSAISEGMDDDSVSAYFESIVSELSNEFALMSRLKGNTNIVSFEDYEVFKIPDDFGWEIFIRMELLTPLTAYISQNTITVKDVALIGIDICKALELCEREQIIHRDIKPENIFVSAHGDFKLGDFGIAKKLENTAVSMTKKGTPSYMAPEVYKGQPYTASVDMYSLGIVLYKLLNNNRNPFMPPYPERIRYNDREAAREKRLSGEPMPAPANAPEDLAKVILKACAYESADRFPDAESMRRALESVLAGDEASLSLYLEKGPDSEKQTVTLKESDISNNNSTKNGNKSKIIIAAGLIAVLFAVLVFAGSLGNDDSGTDNTAQDIDNISDEIEQTAEDASESTTEETELKAAAGEVEFPDYSGTTVTVSDADELREAVAGASSGTVIELESGTYGLGGTLDISCGNIKLIGKGDTKPVLNSMVEINSSGVMLENISIEITKEENTVSAGESVNQGIGNQFDLSGTYLKDVDVTMHYYSSNILYGVMVYSPVMMSGCNIDVSDPDGNSSVAVGAGGRLIAAGNVFSSNGVGIDVFGDGGNLMDDDTLKKIAEDNTINAGTKISVQRNTSF